MNLLLPHAPLVVFFAEQFLHLFNVHKKLRQVPSKPSHHDLVQTTTWRVQSVQGHLNVDLQFSCPWKERGTGIGIAPTVVGRSTC